MILVTGATGLVGFHLLFELAKEDMPVRALYRSATKKEYVYNLFAAQGLTATFEKIDWVEADILDIPKLEEAFQGITQVYHCAALISFDPKDEVKLYQNNIVGTANVVNLCLLFEVEKLCYVSSIATLGAGNPSNWQVTEDTERNMENLYSDYSITKYGAELEVWRGQQEGLNVVVVNPGVVFGDGFYTSGSSVFFNMCKKGMPFYTLGTVAIVAVEDVVKSMITATNSSSSGERFIVVAENWTYRQLFDTLAEALEAKKPSFEAKPWLTSIIWKLDWFLATFLGKKRTLTQATALALHDQSWVDASKLKTAFGIQFRPMRDYLFELAKKHK
nr:NAD-dependent epimerase/dehydratase family protein [uncultured Flavobacterium sp.]